ncbi:hypothetical protein MASR1M59_11820 [Melaminivora sp.]
MRLWHGFLTARVMVALTLLGLLGLGAMAGQPGGWALPLIASSYLLATLLLRVLGRHAPPNPGPGLHWLPSIGLDMLLIAALQTLQPAGAVNFTPLFGLPLLLASVLGTLTLALGTAAGATLTLLAWAAWQGTGENAALYLQAALTGSGYFLVAYLAHQLAARLTSAQQAARLSQVDARTQRAVSALVMQHVADGVLVLDTQGVVRLANPAALLLLGPQGAASAPFALDQAGAWAPLLALAREVFALQVPQTADVNIAQEGGQPPMGLRVRMWPTHTRSAALASEAEPLCVVFVHDLREMEARLRTEKLAAMGRMSAAVAHEIRNPLTAITQASELLAEDLHEATQQRLIQMVQQNAERLARITEEILDIARVQRQAHAPAPPLELDAAVQQIWADWQAQQPQQRRGLLALAAPQARVEFDPEHLRRVLVNLLDNAQRYMGPHADSLCLSTRTTPSGRAGLQVWSDGLPLDKSVERHLFEPFFSSESRSSGLGLYICRELCQRHGASIAYQRTSRPLARGDTMGNAFALLFRSVPAPPPQAAAFATIAP